ncbi:MAG: SMP-30/gluconolactonase/LRE family protein [Spirochaetales bacterium]|nr:SMP-30/gluconolactonase/LRE family protein [Spirochaetales bacterium]
MLLTAERVFTAGNALGEGLFTLTDNEIYWFDILRGKAYHLEIDQINIEEFNLNGFICCAGKTTDGKIISAGLNGLTIVDDRFKTHKTLFPAPFDTKELRFNDGKTGPDGAFWVGSMTHEGDRPVGSLFRVTDKIVSVLDEMFIPNGIGWSPDQKTMYVTDTGYKKISQWDFNAETGRMSNERVFVDAGKLNGVPDGLAVDSEGNIWSAFWGGSCVYGFRPTGEILAEIRLDARNPTNCCFCGTDYASLFITSARHGLSDPNPADGSLFKVDTGNKGTGPYPFIY